MKAWIALGLGLLVFCACSSKHSTEESASRSKLQSLDSSKSQDSLRVGSLNMAIGFDVTSLIGAVNSDSATVYQILQSIDSSFVDSRPYERIGMMADSLVKANLDVIALQEVLELKGSKLGTVQFLQALSDSIAAKGGPKYQSLILSTNPLRLHMPAVDKDLKALDLPSVDLNFTEGNALLIKPGLKILSTDTLHFKSLFGPLYFRTLGLKFYSERGAIGAVLQSAEGRIFQVWSTHLEVELGNIALNQAQELMDALDQKRSEKQSQVVLGDFNFSPGSSGIKLLTAADALADAWEINSQTHGTSCCQLINDSTPTDRSSRTLDYVLLRDALGASSLQSQWIGPKLIQNRWIYGSDHALVRATIHAQN